MQQARHRESRAAVNFAPPTLNRLSEKFTRPRNRYHASDFERSDDALCVSCAALDLERLFRDGIACESRDGMRVRKGVPLGWSDEIYQRATCPLCRLLVEICDTNMSGDDEREVEFWSIITLKGHEVISNVAGPLYKIVDSGSEMSLEGCLQRQAIYFALVRTVRSPPNYGFAYRTVFKDLSFIGLLDAQDRRSLGLRNVGDAAGMTKRVIEWLDRCSRHELCRARKATTWSCPDGFRLFDITSLRVVESRGQEPYIAMSYVCAQVDDVDDIKRGDSYALDTLPKVWQDVVRFVRGLKMGSNYIWMDGVCIDKEDSDQKQNNIRSMGAIYGAAFATIILTVPSRRYLEHGLPVFSAPRVPCQHVETIGNLKLATTFPSLEMTIMTSEWRSRGWTLQEGILSNRCILFGPEQVYFECAEMACSESVRELSLLACPQDHLIPYKSRLENPFFREYDFDALYWRLIQDYTGRDLKYDEDALNAFSAFTAEFERSGHSLIWGLPARGLVRHLLWEHEPWDLREARRRDGFPSWSWAGWRETATMNIPFDAFSKVNIDCTIVGEPPDGRVLCCNARAAHVSISGQGPICTIVGASVSSVMMDCGINAREYSVPRICVLMEVYRTDDLIHGLLLKKIGESYERIGSGFGSLPHVEAMRLQWQELRLI